jgi:hypothetical protein
MVTRLSKTEAIRLHSEDSTMPGHTVLVILIEPCGNGSQLAATTLCRTSPVNRRRRTVPDCAGRRVGCEQSVDILVAAALESPRGQGRSVVTQMTSPGAKRKSARWH